MRVTSRVCIRRLAVCNACLCMLLMLHSPTPMLSAQHRHAPHSSTACSRWHDAGRRRQRGPGSADRQTDTGPAGNTGGSLRAGRRLETYTRMNIFFHIIWTLLHTNRLGNAFIFWPWVNSNYNICWVYLSSK